MLDAEAAFLRALELSPSDQAVIFNLAVLYANHQMEDDLRGTLQQLLEVFDRACSVPHCSLSLILFAQINPNHAGARAMVSRISY